MANLSVADGKIIFPLGFAAKYEDKMSGFLDSILNDVDSGKYGFKSFCPTEDKDIYDFRAYGEGSFSETLKNIGLTPETNKDALPLKAALSLEKEPVYIWFIDHDPKSLSFFEIECRIKYKTVSKMEIKMKNPAGI